MITDDKGNKLPQPRVNKKVQSRNVRLRRIQKQEMNPAFCDECGCRVRAENHMGGEHHQKGKVTE